MSRKLNTSNDLRKPRQGDRGDNLDNYTPSLYVSPIERSTTRQDLIDYFDQFGRVGRVFIKEGKHSDFAIIHFERWFIRDTIKFREDLKHGEYIRRYYGHTQQRDHNNNPQKFWKIVEFKENFRKIPAKPDQPRSSAAAPRRAHAQASVAAASNLNANAAEFTPRASEFTPRTPDGSPPPSSRLSRDEAEAAATALLNSIASSPLDNLSETDEDAADSDGSNCQRYNSDECQERPTRMDYGEVPASRKRRVIIKKML